MRGMRHTGGMHTAAGHTTTRTRTHAMHGRAARTCEPLVSTAEMVIELERMERDWRRRPRGTRRLDGIEARTSSPTMAVESTSTLPGASPRAAPPSPCAVAPVAVPVALAGSSLFASPPSPLAAPVSLRAMLPAWLGVAAPLRAVGTDSSLSEA